MDKDEFKKRANSFKPRIISTNPRSMQREVVRDDVAKIGGTLNPLPPRMGTFNPGTMQTTYGGGGGGQVLNHMQRPYLPEIESPDRMQYPIDRRTANSYWRLFQKLDPMFGMAMDMYSEMLVSSFEVQVEDGDKEDIKNTINLMCEKVDFLDRLKQMVREYLVLGEVFPHCFFNEDLGIWDYIALHNPDNIEVKDSPIINMDPIIYLQPDEELIKLLSDRSPDSIKLRTSLPSEFVSRVLARQPIKLESSNCSFIARRLSPYDSRGTSMASRLWRIWMVEDAVYNSTIATYRRHASPIKVIKLGDAATQWIPDPERETELLAMLSRCEVDPNAWLCWDYGINFEAWGTTDRAISIRGEHDVIEKVKLTALGLSKGFMTGEVSFSSVKGGLQVFLRRLLSLRQYFESVWIYPKFIRPIAIVNGWYKSSPKEIAGGYRKKRTAQELSDENLLIMPKLQWKNKLDPSVDSDLLQALLQMEKLGFDVSQSTVGSVLGLDWKAETKNKAVEWKEKKEIIDKTLGTELAQQYKQETTMPKPGAAPPGGAPKPAGGAAKPPNAAKPTGPGAPGSGEAGTPEESIEAPSEGAMPMGVE